MQACTHVRTHTHTHTHTHTNTHTHTYTDTYNNIWPSSQIFCSFFQLGFVTMFFSDALISGYTTAAGFHALTSQFKYVFDFNMTGVETSDPDAVFIPEIPKVTMYICTYVCTYV